MRCQNSNVGRYFASRVELCSALGEVEKCHDGIFQRTDSPTRTPDIPRRSPASYNLGVLVISLGRRDPLICRSAPGAFMVCRRLGRSYMAWPASRGGRL